MVILNAIGGDDVNGHINLFAWSAITALINAASTSLPMPISCSTITSDPYAEFITLPNAIRNLPRQVMNPAIDLFGGDCAMQEISNLRQESSAISNTVKPFREPPMLVVLCGPSHAGKTTFANRLNKSTEKFAIISPDKIRKQLSIGFQDSRYESRVWDIYESMKRKALEKGCNVVLDACHITEKARWHALQGPNQHHRKICVVFDLPLRTVMERRDKEKRVSSKEVRRMWQAFQRSKPSPEELKLQGFDEVFFIRERHVRALRFTWLGMKAREMKAVRKVFSHKADRLMSAASSVLLWAPTNLCMRARAAHVSDSVLWPSLAHFSLAEPTVWVGCRGTCRQRCFIFHLPRAGFSAWPEGQWFNNKGVIYGYPILRCLTITRLNQL